MKQYLIIILALLFLAACQSNTKKSDNKSKMQTEQTIEYQQMDITVTGMTCEGCEKTVKNTLKQIEGVVEVEASFKKNKVTIKVEKDKVKREEIAQQIETVGYKVED